MTADLFSLDGRVAVVTGSASGLGKAIARGLAGAGAVVACVDVNRTANERVARAIGEGSARAWEADVTDGAAIERVVGEVLSSFGTPAVLVNSAGIGGRGVALEYPDDLWSKVIETNLTGSFKMCREVGRHMVAAGRGAIVNVASIGGIVGFSGSVGYQASKGAVVQMTRTLAVEWAPRGVRVNAIAPGHIATEIVRRQWQTEPELRDFFLARTPVGRLGDPEDVVGATVFLASDAARMVTGQTLAIDGGYTAQ